jgi:hypothetical protein
MGYSTVLQLSQKPLNVVLGDQAAFRVEFINDSITIKPLRPNAKSNIFIFTENDRFNLTIKSGSVSLVDYVIRLRRIYSDPQKTIQLEKNRTNSGLKLSLIRATSKQSEYFLDFSILNQRRKSITLQPNQFRVVCGNLIRPIRSLYLDGSNIKSGATLSGSMLFPCASIDTLSIWLSPTDENPIKFDFIGKNRPSKLAVLHAF